MGGHLVWTGGINTDRTTEGNPGREHENQRHNVGFMVADALQGASAFPPYRSKFNGLWTRGELAGRAAALLKPQTYMNLSGDSVQPAAAFLKVEPGDIVVVHDELDLPWQDVRIKVGGGHAGHNGIRSVQQKLGTPEFAAISAVALRHNDISNVLSTAPRRFAPVQWLQAE